MATLTAFEGDCWNPSPSGRRYFFKVGAILGRVPIDIYNALNSSSVLTLNNAFASWEQPQSILSARFAKVVLQYDF
jgi:hypothetical protein